jgi:transposase
VINTITVIWLPPELIDNSRRNLRIMNSWIVRSNTREDACSGIRILKEAARKLFVWKPFVLNWHQQSISTGKLEVINGKIGTLQSKAYGYRNEEYLRLRIFNLHNSTYALSG